MALSGLRGGSGGIKHLQHLGGAWTHQESVPRAFPEALHLLSAGNGTAQTLPGLGTVWKSCGTGWKCRDAPLTLSQQGFCFWITGEAGSSIFRSAPAFRSCFNPALCLCYILVMNVACVAAPGAGMAFPAPCAPVEHSPAGTGARRVLSSINKALLFFRRGVGVPRG